MRNPQCISVFPLLLLPLLLCPSSVGSRGCGGSSAGTLCDILRAGASALAACVGLAGTSSSADRTVLSPVYTPQTKPNLVWNGLPEKYKFDPFADSEHTDDYYTKDNKDAWGPKVDAGRSWAGGPGENDARARMNAILRLAGMHEIL